MDITERINLAYEFFEQYMHDEIQRAAIKEQPIKLDFMELAAFNPELADLMLDDFSDTVKAFELALANFDFDGKTPHMEVQLYNLPESRRVLIGNLRSKELGKLVFTDGKIKYKTDVRPKVTSARFECPACGNILTVIQTEETFKEPTRCACGRKGKFREISKEFVDAQKISIQENFRDLQSGEQPRDIVVILKTKGLTSPLKERRYLPGSTVRIVGCLRELPVQKAGIKTVNYDIAIDANNVINMEQEAGDIEITEEEEKKIKELSKHPKLYEYLHEALAPGVKGNDLAKDALLLFLFNGPKFTDTTEHIRGSIHMLFIGDPSTAKSKLLEYVHKVHPRSGKLSGPGTKAVGLTATVTKDEHFGWILEGGQLVIYNQGALIVDELDKAEEETKNALHDPLESQEVRVAKANVNAVLPAETAFIASANPKKGRFDAYEDLKAQINFPDTLFSRFDLVIPFFDRPGEEDKHVASFILKKFESAGQGKLQKELFSDDNPFRDSMFYKKYVLYAQRHCNPIITESKCKALHEFFFQVRKMSSESGKVPITFRQMEALIRMTGARAKMRLSDYAMNKDAEFAVKIWKDVLKLYGFDIDAGQVPDMQAVFESGPSYSKQEQRNLLIQTIKIASKLNGSRTVMKSLVKGALLDQVVFDSEEEFDILLDKLIRAGDIFAPKMLEIDGHWEELIGII